MPSIPQAKKIAVKTAIVTLADQQLYSRQYNQNQAMMDALNLTVTEYITLAQVYPRVESFLLSLPENQRLSVVSILLGVGQDYLMQRYGNNRARPLMHSFIDFGLAEMVGEEAVRRFPVLQ